MGLALAGCGGPGSGIGNKEITYTIADPTGDWGFPSPHAHYSRGPGYIRMSLIFDTLVWKDDQGYVPALAKSWQYLKEENAYLLELQRGVTWHDGKKFTAGDVVFTFQYMQKHPYQWVDTTIVNQAEAIDDHTVKLYLSKPYAPFLTNVLGTLPILPEHIWKGVENPEQFQEKEALVGTGPFQLVDYNKEQGIYLYAANENYYQGKPQVGQLKFIKMGEQVAASALQQQQVNAAQVPPELVGALEKEGFQILEGSHDWVAKLMINHRRDPLAQTEFRQALAYAIDRQALVEICLRGHGLAGSPGLLPPDNPWYNPAIEPYGYNPARAGEILAGLGYTRQGDYYRKDGRVLELELLIRGGTAATAGAPGEREGELVKEQLERAGIKVNLRSLEAKTLDSRVGEWQFDLALSGHGGLGGDPQQSLNQSILGQGFNSARYEGSELLNGLLQSQLREMDEDKRRELVAGVQEHYAREMPAIPLYYPTWYWVHDGSVPLYYTTGGVGSGVPVPVNKMAFLKR
ncbi:ABC transporter substrate-binding protein [Clostridiales bacterium PH28_bin88]|nr:ABC transporter substrate-binding protein [Clostridiales bacterium PH28_bin88]